MAGASVMRVMAGDLGGMRGGGTGVKAVAQEVAGGTTAAGNCRNFIGRAVVAGSVGVSESGAHGR